MEQRKEIKFYYADGTASKEQQTGKGNVIGIAIGETVFDLPTRLARVNIRRIDDFLQKSAFIHGLQGRLPFEFETKVLSEHLDDYNKKVSELGINPLNNAEIHLDNGYNFIVSDGTQEGSSNYVNVLAVL